MNRRTFLKRFALGTVGVVGAGDGGYYYAHEIEPSWLKVVENEIHSIRIPNGFDGFTIMQLTDTHLGFQYDIEDFEQMINKVNQLQPDLIVFTGDLMDDPSLNTNKQYASIIERLKKLEAPHGKYWVYGNHDHGGYGTEKIDQVMAAGGFELLKNQAISIEKDQQLIHLAGIDDALLGDPQMQGLIDESQQGDFNILLAHEPDYADTVKNYPFDVQLFGHSHGGQIQLPVFGSIITPSLGEKYVEGDFKLGPRPLQLFVSKGLGTTRLPFRFLCRPEINLYTLRKESTSSST